jgi:hypothetical protein
MTKYLYEMKYKIKSGQLIDYHDFILCLMSKL